MILLLLVLFNLTNAFQDQALEKQFCETFRGNSLYVSLKLGEGSCTSNVFPKGNQLCLADPDDDDQPIPFTCKTREEIEARYKNYDCITKVLYYVRQLVVQINFY